MSASHAVFLHGFGVRYDLPIPLALYLYAAGAVVALSFVLVAIFGSRKVGARAVEYPRTESAFLTNIARTGIPQVVGGVIGVATLLAIILTGFFGAQEPTRNPAEYLTWIYFWAGLVILSGLVGNLWTLVNPWVAIYDLVTRRRRRAAARQLPAGLGIWPAVIVYFAFATFELASGVANKPWLVATLALLYSMYTLAGMALFGRNQWLQRCEAFTVLFGIVGRFGPVESVQSDTGRIESVSLRPWGTGLLQPAPVGQDWNVFVILMLASLAFDGIEATPPWFSFQQSLFPYLQSLPGGLATALIKTLGLALIAVSFYLIFLAFMQLVMLVARRTVDQAATTSAFVFTLVPIALVYNAAHNYSYLLVQSQGLLPLLNDPLGRGWHLLPSLATYQPSFALAGAATVWYMQVVLIVAGHVLAVWLSHLRAGERFKSARAALISQYPMLILMVAYTMTSLWILAQPITREA